MGENHPLTITSLSHLIPGAIQIGPLSFQVEKGKLLAIVGPDGAGKTTLMRILAHLQPCDAGTIALPCQRANTSPHSLLGYVSQHFSLYQDLSVRENLELIAALFSLRAPAHKIEELLLFADLIPFQNRLTRQLSGGMKQKLSLAAAILHDPPLLLLDEPTTGLDPMARASLWALLRTLGSQGKTIVYATSVLEEAEYADQVLMMHLGVPIAYGSPADLKAASSLSAAIIDTPTPRELFRRLKSNEPTLHAHLRNNGVRIASPPSWGRHNLDRYGDAITHIEWTSPSLEEIFLQLTTTPGCNVTPPCR